MIKNINIKSYFLESLTKGRPVIRDFIYSVINHENSANKTISFCDFEKDRDQLSAVGISTGLLKLSAEKMLVIPGKDAIEIRIFIPK